jgi:hypothetical protein
MTPIELNDVGVEFVIYQGSSRSLKKTFLRAGTGGGVGPHNQKNPTLPARSGQQI